MANIQTDNKNNNRSMKFEMKRRMNCEKNKGKNELK